MISSGKVGDVMIRHVSGDKDIGDGCIMDDVKISNINVIIQLIAVELY